MFLPEVLLSGKHPSLQTIGIKYLLPLIMLIFSACDNIPADPNKSYEKAIGTGLSVGYAINPPWVSENEGIVEGYEAEIIKGFADSNGMKIVWVPGSEQTLMKKLEKKELHIVITGMTMDNPWKSMKIGITLPYYKVKKAKHVIAVQQGENRLTMNLEKYFYSNRSSIAKMINETKQKL